MNGGSRIFALLAGVVLLAGCGVVERATQQGQEQQQTVTAAADVVTLVGFAPDTGRKGRVEVPADQRRFVTPHVAFSVESVTVTDVLHELTAGGYELPGPARAAIGQEFVVATFGDDGFTAPYGRDEKAPVTITVVAGETRTKLDERPQAHGGLLVSVDKGTDVRLEVTDADRTFTYDLRAGRRGADAVALYQRAQRSATVTAKYQGTGGVSYRGWGRPVTVEGTFDKVYLEPWMPGRGWAAPGRAWLMVNGSVSSNSLDYDIAKQQFPVKVQLDLAQTFSVTLPDGQVLRPASRMVNVTYTLAVDSINAVIDVPDTFTTGTLKFAPAGQVNALFKEVEPVVSWKPTPASGSYEIRMG